MEKITARQRVQNALAKMEGFVEVVQFLLSAMAVAFVIANEFVPHAWEVPWLNIPWHQLQVWTRITTWIVFVTVFAVYALVGGRPIKYVWGHLPELAVCLTGIPYYNGALLQHIKSLTSLEMLTVIGSIAHAYRVARWTIHRFREHPLIVVAVAMLVLIGSASALLTMFEPQTFPTMAESAWFSVVTVFTVGYGDFTPKTQIGRLIATGLIVSGVAMAGVFIGAISKIVQNKLLDKGQDDTTEKLAKQIEENSRLLKEVLAQQQLQNELNRQLLEELKQKRQTPEQ